MTNQHFHNLKSTHCFPQSFPHFDFVESINLGLSAVKSRFYMWKTKNHVYFLFNINVEKSII